MEITHLQKDKQDYIEENIDLKREIRMLKAEIRKLKQKRTYMGSVRGL